MKLDLNSERNAPNSNPHGFRACAQRLYILRNLTVEVSTVPVFGVHNFVLHYVYYAIVAQFTTQSDRSFVV